MRRLFLAAFILISSAARATIAADSAPLTAPTDHLLAHLKFDGDTRDSGPSGWNGTPVGRVSFIDSPIGGQGKLLSLNGVDAFVQLENPAAGNFDGQDFAVSLWIMPLELRWAGVIQKVDPKQAWSLFIAPNGSVHCSTTTGGQHAALIDSPPGSIEAGEWFHLALTVQRSGASAGTRLYINGILSGEGPVPAGPLNSPAPLFVGRGEGPGAHCSMD